MKCTILLLIFLLFGCLSCNNSGKDSVDKADSINQANLDTGLRRNAIVIDESSSSFPVRAADAIVIQREMAAVAQQKAISPDIKNFASQLLTYHTALTDSLRKIADQKNIAVPITVSEENQKDLEALQKTVADNRLDDKYLSSVIKNYEAVTGIFETAMIDAKDMDIRSFADKTLISFKTYLNRAKELQKKDVKRGFR